jgi:hypothetical protein
MQPSTGAMPMRGKVRLEIEKLSVDSFAVAEGEEAQRGTVRAAQEGIGQEGCTKWQSCDCYTAFYRCVEHYYTDYSCDYDTTGPRLTPYC